ncbi:MAG: class I SAM-dependent methyltransferase [Pseudomonadota bacterium]
MPALAHAAAHHAPALTPSIDRSAIPFLSAWIGSWQFSINRKPMAGDELKSAYDIHATGWSKKLKRLSIQDAYEGMLAHIVANAPQEREGAHPMCVLDAGVGAADLSLAFATVADRKFSLDAFDISPRMLDESERRLKAQGVTPNLHLADATKLPFEDNQFDIIMTAHMLEHLPTPALALRELIRVLKPGGRLIAFITRRSMLGYGIQLKWRVHAVTPDIANNWLSAGGLQGVHCVERNEKNLLDRLSVVCVGRKPEAVAV